MANEEIREENIHKALDAGVLCFIENGIANTQILSVAAKAEISKRSFLRYFDNKDKFVIAVIKSVNVRYYNKGRKCYQEIMEKYSCAADRLRALMMVTRDFFLAHPEIFILLSEGQAYVMNSSERSAVLRQYSLLCGYWPSVVLSTMQQGVTEGSITCFTKDYIKKNESDSLWYAYIGLMVQLAYAIALGNISIEDCEETITRFMEQALQSLN